MPQQDDYTLIEQSKTDINAFESLYDRYFAKIYAYIRSRVSTKEEAEDITSDIFLSAIKYIANFNSKKGSFSSWLYKSAHNKIIDLYRRKGRSNQQLDEFNSPTLPDDNFENAQIEAERAQVNEILIKIHPDYQLVLSLRYFSELTNPEIAEVLNCKPSNVAVIMNRALASFKKEFSKKFPKSEIFELVNRNN